jgi:site-specific recombinase XerD
MKRHTQPVAKAIGIHKKIGWHAFRHSFGTLLKANGEDVKTVRELLRLANSRIMLDVYTQAVSSNILSYEMWTPSERSSIRTVTRSNHPVDCTRPGSE